MRNQNFAQRVLSDVKSHYRDVVATAIWLSFQHLAIVSAFGYRFSAGVSLFIGRSLNANVYVVFAGEASCLVEANVALRSFNFRVVAVYSPNIFG